MIGKLAAKELEITHSRILELATELDEDEDGVSVIVSDYAISTALAMTSAAAELTEKFCRPWVVESDYSGSLTLVWSFPERGTLVRFSIPATSQESNYLYAECENAFEGKLNLTATELAEWIEWVYDRW
jgi:hypothetical protein